MSKQKKKLSAVEQVDRDCFVVVSGNGKGKHGLPPCDKCGHHRKLHRAVKPDDEGKLIAYDICDSCDGLPDTLTLADRLKR